MFKAPEALKRYGEYNIPVVGKCILTVQYKVVSRKVQFFIVAGDQQQLLDKKACVDLELINLVVEVNTTQPQETAVEDRYSHIIKEYDNVVQGLGCLPGEHTIIVDETSLWQSNISPTKQT